MDDYKLRRNARIKKEFGDMYDRRKLRLDYCLECLAEKYGIRPQTIMHIIKGYGVYAETLTASDGEDAPFAEAPA